MGSIDDDDDDEKERGSDAMSDQLAQRLGSMAYVSPPKLSLALLHSAQVNVSTPGKRPNAAEAQQLLYYEMDHPRITDSLRVWLLRRMKPAFVGRLHPENSGLCTSVYSHPTEPQTLCLAFRTGPRVCCNVWNLLNNTDDAFVKGFWNTLVEAED
jgi:hypothetical protein